MMVKYIQLLTYIKSAMPRNHSEKSIYSALEALGNAKNGRLSFKTNTKLGKLYFDRSNFGKLQKFLNNITHLANRRMVKMI